jgi:signal transduction histidine kinase
VIQNSLEALREGGEVEVLSTQYSVLGTSADHVRVDPPHLPVSLSPSLPLSLSPPPVLRTPRFLLTVTDTGPGIPPEVRPHIFDPFFSGREAGRGLGLGLSKAWRIVTLHGGTLTVESEPGAGARFSILLPAE